MQGIQFEREAIRRLPGIIAELFDEPAKAQVTERGHHDGGADVVIDAAGRRWVVQATASSSPGTIAKLAGQRSGERATEAVQVLVVPYMTPAGAKAATARGLNWIDLAGNAHLRDGDLYVSVQGRANTFKIRGRPSSAFAPKSSRVARAFLLDPHCWWSQKELAQHTALDPGHMSRIVHRLDEDDLLERSGSQVRPRDPDVLLDAWADDYRFQRHDILTGHLSGNGLDLARDLHQRLLADDLDHAFTGLPAAWAIGRFARFRLVSVYVVGDPRAAADVLGLRRNERGANVQLIGPDDPWVLDGRRTLDKLPCVSPVQAYLDLRSLPERSGEAADQLRTEGMLWHADA